DYYCQSYDSSLRVLF
nr:immunoglobulin light chain junction region [Macaca mulatta]MOX28067.1 immunoglobulin light chain junction region [Macaca mulatta]MOX28077.1 immunoglobulin light chain junction region [Macaca mulatta]MOX28291.1 immunoglobulin light chain junction region [Macaca mulatta]MOX28336.1 immunoglobulin light chain junction region [Macaca mulatta]